MGERWLPIPGYESLYEVSDLGRVRSLDRHCLGADGRREFHAGKVLKGSLTKRGGYVDVSLRDGKHRLHRTVHSLVAEAFLGPRPDECDVMHLNGDRTDNRLENLRYGTRADNLHQTYEYGGKQAAGKLSASDVQHIRRRLRANERVASIANSYGVDRAAIYHIRNGTTFKWLLEEVVENE